MDSEMKFWLALWITVAVMSVMVVATITTGICYHRKTMIENGFEEVRTIGSHVPVWQKVD